MSASGDPSTEGGGFNIDELLECSLNFQVRERYDPKGVPRHAAQRAIADLYYLRGWKVTQQLFIKGADANLYFSANCAPTSVDAHAIDALNVWEGPFRSSIVAGGGKVSVRYSGPSAYFAEQFVPAVLRSVTFEPTARLLEARKAEGRRAIDRYRRPSLWTILTERVPERDLEPPKKLRPFATGLTVVRIALRIANHFR